jgi:transposase
MLPNKARGVPRVDDRRVLNGIIWVLRSGASWRDLEQLQSIHHLLNRFVRCEGLGSGAGSWTRPPLPMMPAG